MVPDDEIKGTTVLGKRLAEDASLVGTDKLLSETQIASRRMPNISSLLTQDKDQDAPVPQ